MKSADIEFVVFSYVRSSIFIDIFFFNNFICSFS